MRTPFRTVSAGSLAVVFVLAFVTAGCGKYSFSSLKGRKAIKEAHEYYKASRWKEATELYEVAVASDPTLQGAHFFLANSYDNLYKPSRAGEPENDAYMQKAIEWYKKAADNEPDALLRQRAMEYFVAAYGPDKLNNPIAAEPIVKKMIEINPSEHTNYFALAKIYEDAGRYDEAEQALMKAKELKPNEPTVYTTLSNFYNRQGEFEKTMDALQRAADLQPDNPQGYQLVAVYYWEKAFKDKRLSTAQQRDYIAKGIDATDKALKLNKDYAEALTYKNILLRMQANTETDRKKMEALIKEADSLRARAQEILKKKTAGTAGSR